MPPCLAILSRNFLSTSISIPATWPTASRPATARNRWTYREVAETAGRFARELESAWDQRRRQSIILGPNSAEWAAAFWGSHSARSCGCTRWIGRRSGFYRASRSPSGRKINSCRARKRASFGNAIPVRQYSKNLCAIVSRQSAGNVGDCYTSPPLDRAAIAEIVFTSGTTGEPKGVDSHSRQIFANIEPIEPKF